MKERQREREKKGERGKDTYIYIRTYMYILVCIVHMQMCVCVFVGVRVNINIASRGKRPNTEKMPNTSNRHMKMNMQVCMYTVYVCLYIDKCILVYICMCVFEFVFVFVCVCVCVCVCMCVCVYVWVPVKARRKMQGKPLQLQVIYNVFCSPAILHSFTAILCRYRECMCVCMCMCMCVRESVCATERGIAQIRRNRHVTLINLLIKIYNVLC